MSNDKRFFNFPICLLQDFIYTKNNNLDNILHFALYDHALNKLKHGSMERRFLESAKYHRVSLGDANGSLDKGMELYEEHSSKKVKAGIETEMFWDFMNNEKTLQEQILLLGFLALKSILQKQSYCKVTNLYWLSRMDGKSCSHDSIEDLSTPIKSFANEYQLNKIKSELMENWGMINYGRYTRGFYVSSKMSLEDLVFEVEKKRKARKAKQQKEDKKAALAKALERLNEYSNSHDHHTTYRKGT